MADKALGLQDNFLNSVRRAKTPVTIFLVKGVKLQGVITWFDSFSLLLRRDGSAQLVYKHSISTIMPGQLPEGFVAPETIVQTGEGRRAPLQDLFLAAAARQHEADDRLSGQRRDADRRSGELRPILRVARARRAWCNWSTSMRFRRCSRRITSASTMSRTRRRAIERLQPRRRQRLCPRRAGLAGAARAR